MISLLNALYMLGAAAVGVPIILHLLRRRPTKDQPFPSFLFLHATAARKQSRNNIRKWLVLLLRCLALLLLALAFSWPYLPRFKRPPEQLTALLWDQSFSMQARPYRNELRGRARRVINDAGEGRPVAVALVADRVQWSGDFSEDADALGRWFDDHTVADGTSRLDRALRLADRKLQGASAASKRIVLITDRQLLPWQDVKWSEKLSAGTKLEVITPQRPGFENLAIVEARIAGPFTEANQRLPLRVGLRNYQRRPVIAQMVTTFQGHVVDRRELEVDSLDQTTVTLFLTAEKLEPQFGNVQIRLNDELHPDNEAWFVANPSHPPKVYLTRPPRGSTDFIHTALAPTDQRRAAEVRELSEEIPAEQLVSAGAAIVRRGMAPDSALAKQLDQALRQGATVVAVWQDTPTMRQWLGTYGVAAAAAAKPGTRRLGSVDFDHPVFIPFLDVRTAGLFEVLFFDPPQLAMPEKARVLAHFDNGNPALAELSVGEGRLIVVCTEMSRDATDWPLSASFLPLWRQLLAYAQKDREGETAFTVSARPLPLGQVQEARRMDSGHPVALQGGRFVALQVGAYLVRHGGQETAIAVNVPPEESDPLLLAEDFPYQRLVSKAPAPARIAMERAAPQESRSFWWALLVAALAMTMSEILLANRTAL